MRFINPLSIISLLLLVIPGCGLRKKATLKRSVVLSQVPKQSASIETGKPYPLTIWIHGTRLLPQGVFERFFYTEPGLHHYTFLDSQYKHHQIVRDIIASDPEYFVAEGFHIFGWSGKLSFQTRKQAAQSLYQELRSLRESYKERWSQEPIIRIISHSHGGNVALNLAAVKDPADETFMIEELILLACPVQKETASYICDPLFNHVYSLYSQFDMIQVLDPQGLYSGYPSRTIPTFSGRCFDCAGHVDQIQIMLDKHAAFHIDFIRSIFVQNLGLVLNTIKEWREQVEGEGKEWVHTEKVLNLYREPLRKVRIARITKSISSPLL